MTGWTTVNGVWADTIDGNKGALKEIRSFIFSKATDFTYEADVAIKDGNGRGAGALVFRADQDVKTDTLPMWMPSMTW
ncbi:hypothetical protein PO124_29905 [Bacillus licheniformis]|nr:hypothetical protein [Bacillus licheniformis]